jgi:integrase
MARKQGSLPPYCLHDKYGYRLKPYLGRVHGKTKWGKTINLAPPDALMSEVWRAYEEAIGDDRQTVGWLLDLYKDSDRFGELSPKSQKEYASAIEKLTGAPVGDDRFGSVRLDQVDKRSIRSYLDTYPSPVAANRHIAVLKSAWNWVLERHEIPDNPCIGVKLNREAPRERYVTDDEYETVLRMAPPPISQMMQLAYLLRARLSEVQNLKVSDVSDTHVRLIRLKGSEGELTMLSDRLRGVLSDVRGGDMVTHRYSQSAFRSAWRRLQAKMKKAGIEPFSFHDLKSKGISDHESNWGGHRSPAMRKTYVRKLQEIPATR